MYLNEIDGETLYGNGRYCEECVRVCTRYLLSTSM